VLYRPLLGKPGNYNTHAHTHTHTHTPDRPPPQRHPQSQRHLLAGWVGLGRIIIMLLIVCIIYRCIKIDCGDVT